MVVMRNRMGIAGLGLAGAAMLAWAHPTTRFSLALHDAGDPSPRRVQAAVDTGLGAVSLVVSWTARELTR